MMYSEGDHFGKRTAWPLLYFLNYVIMIVIPVSNFGDQSLGKNENFEIISPQCEDYKEF